MIADPPRRKRGRPPKPPGEAIREHYSTVSARLHPDEKADFVNLCTELHTTPNAEIQRFVRQMLADAKKEIGE